MKKGASLPLNQKIKITIGNGKSKSVIRNISAKNSAIFDSFLGLYLQGS